MPNIHSVFCIPFIFFFASVLTLAFCCLGLGAPQGKAAAGWRISVFRQGEEDPEGGTVVHHDGDSIKVGRSISLSWLIALPPSIP